MLVGRIDRRQGAGALVWGEAMSSSHVVIGIGLGLDVLATLFLSLDAFGGQQQLGKLFEVQAYTLNLDRILRKGNGASGASGPVLPPGNWVDEALALVQDAGEDAQQKNYNMVVGKMNEISGAMARRRWIVGAAIAAVFVGGVLEFIGGVVLGG